MNMKRLYIIIVALLSVCYIYAQERIYVHRSNGNIEAISLDQLDSLSFITTKAHLQITADNDTVRVGEVVDLYSNIVEGSVMNVKWGTRTSDLLYVYGSYNTGYARGLAPGQAEVQAVCDELVATYPLIVIGRATSTGAPQTYWEVASKQVQAGEQIAFEAQYDSKNYPVDYTAVWYDLAVVEEKKATCTLIKAFDYSYTQNAVATTIQPLAEQQRYTHNSNSWSNKTSSYLCTDHFSATLNDTLATEEWNYPRDTTEFTHKIKSYFGATFPQVFKDSVKAQMDANNERNYNAYMQVFTALSLVSAEDIEWMTDSVFNANSHTWKKVFKQNDTIWSTTHFDTLDVYIDTTYKVTGRPPRQDTVWYYDTVFVLKPWVEKINYIYPQVVERIDRLWRDSVSYIDLLVSTDGYAVEYKKSCQVNAEFRVYDKKGNYAKSNPHTIVLENSVEKIKINADNDPIIVNTALTLQAGKYYTARQGKKQYQWLFPEGTQNAATGAAITSYEGETTPSLVFTTVGSQKVTLITTINGVRLPSEVMTINVAGNQALPTLYYATVQGNIMAYKLANATQSQTVKYQPYDLGFYAEHAFNLLFKDSLLYVLDAGKQFGYMSDYYGAGDGKISVLSKDGSRVETMLNNLGQFAEDDPYFGYIEGDYLYYTDRNIGIVKLHLSDRQMMGEWGLPYYVQNNTLGYYNRNWSYGSINANIGKINGVWHWCKIYNGYGIFRFKDSDILPAPITRGEEIPQDGVMIEGVTPKSFVYVPKHNKILVHILDIGYNGLYACTYEELDAIGDSRNMLRPYAVTYNGQNFESNTTSNLPAIEGYNSEAVGICQMVYDETTDCVYFAYRNNSYNTSAFPPTGIYRYNVTTGEVTCLIEGVEAYGITVNNQPSILF